MSQPQVRATICVQSETFHQTYEEPVGDSSTNDPSQFYEQLIAANDRLRASISKTLTDFVNKARLEQQEHGEKSKRKLTREHPSMGIAFIRVFSFSF